MTHTTERLLTVGDVATMFGVDPKTVTRWERAGRFASLTVIYTPGGHRRFDAAEMRAFIEELSTRPDPAARCADCGYLITSPGHRTKCP